MCTEWNWTWNVGHDMTKRVAFFVKTTAEPSPQDWLAHLQRLPSIPPRGWGCAVLPHHQQQKKSKRSARKQHVSRLRRVAIFGTGLPRRLFHAPTWQQRIVVEYLNSSPRSSRRRSCSNSHRFVAARLAPAVVLAPDAVPLKWGYIHVNRAHGTMSI